MNARTSVLSTLSLLCVVASACSDTPTNPSTVFKSGVVTTFAKSGTVPSGGGGGGGVVPPPAGVLTGPVFIRESFGFDPLGDNATFIRYDGGNNPQQIWLSRSINGMRVESPSLSSEIWLTPDLSKSPSWAFAVSTPDPLTVEPPGSYDHPEFGENGTLASNVNPTIQTDNAALVAFNQPAGPVTASISAIDGYGYNIAVGFTPSGSLTSNFQNSNSVYLVLRMPATTPQTWVGTWELHTGGAKGATISGTTNLDSYNHIAISYDPDLGVVTGRVNGVVTGSLPFKVTGVKYVGFQGNGIVNDFKVEAGAIVP